MKPLRIIASLIGVAAALLPWRALAEAKPTPASSADHFAGPQSVFVIEPGFGKDPFFPNSTRIPKPKTNDVVVPTPPSPTVPDEIVLKGVNLLKDRRYAIINNYTVAQGEEFPLKIKGTVHHVRCVEIKDKSVIVSVKGVSKELTLRPGIF
jgi:hypothetical protein